LKNVLTCLVWFVFLFLTRCESNTVAGNADSGFTSIFDGKTLSGWEGDSTYWKVDTGNILGEVTASTLLKRNSFLIWRGGITRNFELKVNFKISDKGNSGINYRSEEMQGVPNALKGYQADLDGQNNYSGSNYEERARTTLAARGEKVILPNLIDTTDQYLKYSKDNRWTRAEVVSSLGNKDSLASLIKSNDWNEYHLIANGNHLQHYINGKLMSDVTDNDTLNRRMSGLLGVQVHVGPPMTIRYRNFRIKAL
jgi:hypothetical protein